MMLFATPDTQALAAIVIPFIGAILIPLAHRIPNLRETITLATAALVAVTVWGLLPGVLAGGRPGLLRLC